MPRVSDELRYSVRNVTADRLLEQLGCKERLASWEEFAATAQRALQNIKGLDSLPLAIQKQMQKVHLFASETTSQPASGQERYLLGQFDCLCVPARADYNASFMPIAPTAGAAAAGDPLKAAAAVEAGQGGTPDCDGASGFRGWFWVVHSAAPNIGESEEADDFGAYSEQVPAAPAAPSGAQGPAGAPGSPRGSPDSPTDANQPQRRLHEDRYVADMARLWRASLIAMGRLEVGEAIVFPFGMGAFLRHLGQNDSRYNDPRAMRKLRRRVADELMNAIVDLCCGGAAPASRAAQRAAAKVQPPVKAVAAKARPGPAHVHLCLVCANAESVENHNCFVEAAASAFRVCQGLSEVLRLRRNVDTLQLAHDLIGQDGGGERSLKVGILNGANRELVGNHWFEDGARFAIDENLHRRSASLARAALLLNFDTEPRRRRPMQLAENVRFFGGSVMPLGGLPAAGTRGGCCKRRSNREGTSGQSKAKAKANLGKCTKGHELKPWKATGGWCNRCKREVKPGEQVMDCRPCDYFVCSACTSQQDLPAATAGAAAPGRPPP
uniref:Uncharacterized protein n=2 Tax=Alexandrium monilatum TaxID=311494 RepID=A0A7S4V065_9DINO|mmetsp:Transcript_98466/g.303524  ORF Transcript_98466/g.303524 Transcript_98466/m.303524 type:complete len:553 (+) Transcript_98466:300-1958(+)